MSSENTVIGIPALGALVDYEQIKRLVPITAVLAHYHIELRTRGAELVGACPVHGGSNTRQFIVTPAKNRWRCFSDCNRGGSVLDLVAALERVSIPEAAERLASWFALPLKPLETTARNPTMPGMPPSHKAYAVENRNQPDDKSYWTRIGSAWPHTDGKGLNIVLSAFPIGGRIVLREATQDDAKLEQADKPQRKK